MIEVNEEHKKEIYDLLIQLRKLSEAFNQMVGYLYSNICADEISGLINELKEKYNVTVNYYQYMPGRICYTNLDRLIELYGN